MYQYGSVHYCTDPHYNTVNDYSLQNLQNAPALLLSGPSGSGKSALCLTILQSLKLPHTIVSGVGFSTARSFIVSVWDKLRDQLRAHRIHLQEKHNTSILLGATSRKAIKFSDLALSCGAVIDRILDCPPRGLDPEEECYYLVLDVFHHIAAQDNTLATSLLNLAQVSVQYCKSVFSVVVEILCSALRTHSTATVGSRSSRSVRPSCRTHINST
jgi:hypothetical protein